MNKTAERKRLVRSFRFSCRPFGKWRARGKMNYSIMLFRRVEKFNLTLRSQKLINSSNHLTFFPFSVSRNEFVKNTRLVSNGIFKCLQFRLSQPNCLLLLVFKYSMPRLRLISVITHVAWLTDSRDTSEFLNWNWNFYNHNLTQS